MSSSKFYARRPLSEISFTKSFLLSAFQFSAKRGLRKKAIVLLPLLSFICFKGNEEIAQFVVQQSRCHTLGTKNSYVHATWAEVQLGEGGQGAGMAEPSLETLKGSQVSGARTWRVMNAGNFEWR